MELEFDGIEEMYETFHMLVPNIKLKHEVCSKVNANANSKAGTNFLAGTNLKIRTDFKAGTSFKDGTNFIAEAFLKDDTIFKSQKYLEIEDDLKNEENIQNGAMWPQSGKAISCLNRI